MKTDDRAQARLLRVCAIAAALSALIALSGCAHSSSRDEQPGNVATAEPAGGDPAAELGAQQGAEQADVAEKTAVADSESTAMAAAPADPSTLKDYVVKKGDTLSQIARLYIKGNVYGSTGGLARLIELNPSIKNPDFLLPGQKIALVAQTAREASAPAESVAEQPAQEEQPATQESAQPSRTAATAELIARAPVAIGRQVETKQAIVVPKKAWAPPQESDTVVAIPMPE